MLRSKSSNQPSWHFTNPSPHLIKVVIDLRPSTAAWRPQHPQPSGNLQSGSGNIQFGSSSSKPPPSGQRPVGAQFPPLVSWSHKLIPILLYPSNNNYIRTKIIPDLAQAAKETLHLLYKMMTILRTDISAAPFLICRLIYGGIHFIRELMVMLLEGLKKTSRYHLTLAQSSSPLVSWAVPENPNPVCGSAHVSYCQHYTYSTGLQFIRPSKTVKMFANTKLHFPWRSRYRRKFYASILPESCSLPSMSIMILGSLNFKMNTLIAKTLSMLIGSWNGTRRITKA